VIIGLGFKARTGKDTIAEMLVEHHGFTRIAFADALKRGCMEMFGLTQEQCYGDTKEVLDEFWGVTPRYILQKVGTECMREQYDSDIWVKSVQKKVTNGGNWVVTDVRFPNEAAAVQRWGGYLVRVERDGVGASGGIANHPSETSMINFKGWDYVVKNNGTLAELRDKVEYMQDWMFKDLVPEVLSEK